LQILSSIEPVAAKSRSVLFHPDRIGPAATLLDNPAFATTSWEHPCHFFDDSEKTLRWIFVLDILNHCFWPERGKPAWSVLYKGQTYSGYWGLAAALKRAQESGIPLTDPAFLAGIN
jgi:hypothetical protein